MSQEGDKTAEELPEKLAESMLKIAKFYMELKEVKRQQQERKDAEDQKQEAELKRLAERKTDQEQRQADKADMMEQQRQLQAEQQEFQRKQNEAMTKAFKEAGISPTQQNIDLTEKAVERLGEIDGQKKDLNAKIGKIDEQVDKLNKESQNILTKEPLGGAEDLQRLKEIEGEKVKLGKEKTEMVGQVEKLDTERKNIMQGKGLEMDGPSQDLDIQRNRSNALSGKDDPRMPKPNKVDPSTMQGKVGPPPPSLEGVGRPGATTIDVQEEDLAKKQKVDGELLDTAEETLGTQDLGPPGEKLPQVQQGGPTTSGIQQGKSPGKNKLSASGGGEDMGQSVSGSQEQLASIGNHTRPLSKVRPKSTLASLVSDGSAQVGTEDELSKKLKIGRSQSMGALKK